MIIDTVSAVGKYKKNMNKLHSKTKRERHKRHTIRCENHRLSRGDHKPRSSDSNAISSSTDSNGKDKSRSSDNGANSYQQDIIFDHDIDIYDTDNRKKLAEKCHIIRNTPARRIHLTFVQGKMNIFYAAGMLLLYTEIYRKMKNDCTISCDYPHERKAEQVLQHIGFLKMVGRKERISAEEISRSDDDVRSWHVISGIIFDGARVDELLEKVAPSLLKENKIYIAIKELIGNAIEHAYTEEDKIKSWTVFVQVSKNQKLAIVVGDLGRTIPITMAQNSSLKEAHAHGSFKPLKKTFVYSDSNLIRHAVTKKASITMKQHRGRGLENALKNIKGLNGHLSIYSRKGLYKDTFSRADARKHHKIPQGEIEGTIVQIEIPIPSRMTTMPISSFIKTGR